MRSLRTTFNVVINAWFNPVLERLFSTRLQGRIMCVLHWEFAIREIVYPEDETKRYALHESAAERTEAMNSDEENGISATYYTQPALSSDRSIRSGDLRGGRGGWRGDT